MMAETDSVISTDFFSSGFERLIFVRYLDHVLYNRTSALAMQPQIRKAIGWLVYECEQYVILAWDCDDEPPTLHGGDPKASGLVLLKSDILELKRLDGHGRPLKENSGCHLNCKRSIVKGEYALQPKKRKTRRQLKKETVT